MLDFGLVVTVRDVLAVYLCFASCPVYHTGSGPRVIVSIM